MQPLLCEQPHFHRHSSPSPGDRLTRHRAVESFQSGLTASVLDGFHPPLRPDTNPRHARHGAGKYPAAILRPGWTNRTPAVPIAHTCANGHAGAHAHRRPNGNPGARPQCAHRYLRYRL